ncbi:muscle M-line assembly protein unc-89-like [Topomyia yanbarensis]|uniref:muscle M-line assembly protein unc-89-like n=1 Tax=Topomyia yanbarensis TaxID=2498891 RepID=UPI00273ABF4E|nr:muscle M-line assembly protein unc-89-like [Topomyia yanbarensis]
MAKWRLEASDNATKPCRIAAIVDQEQIEPSKYAKKCEENLEGTCDTRKTIWTEYYDLRPNDLVLETQVHGVPNPEVQWFKDNEVVIYDGKYMLNREPNGKYQLRIHKPQQEDCGIYECRAKNNDGQTKVQHEVKFGSNEQFVHVHRIEYADRLKRQLEEELAFSSRNLLLQSVQSSIVDKKVDKEYSGAGAFETIESKIETSSSPDFVPEEEKSLETQKSKSAHRIKAMPRRRFYDGPSEPFVIRDSKKKLTWATKLKNVTAQEGGVIKLVCIVTGPLPQYKWFKNGKPLVWSKETINECNAEFGCVRIKNLNLIDCGEYIAVAKNADSEIECCCKVTVFPKTKDVQTSPTFTRITDYYDIRVNDLVLEVHVRGMPAPTLTWERDGRELQNGMDKIIIAREKDGVYKLSIHNPEKLDGGQWVIKAKNSAGEEKAKHYIIFKGKEHHQHIARIYHADKRDEILLPRNALCVLPTIKSQPWKQSLLVNGDESNDVVSKITKEGILQELEGNISTKPQKREWRKKLSTLYSSEHRQFTEAQMVSKMLDSKQKLSFDVQLKNITVAEGSSIKMVCSCTGPSPSIKWYKNNLPIAWSKTLKNDTKLGIGAMHFETTSVNDSGTYKCVASNNFGEIETSCALTVYPVQQNQFEAPKFTRNVKEYFNVQVNDLVLELHVRGDPPPNIKWFRDGVQLENIEGNKFFALREPDGIHKLTIHDPQWKDEGRYVCEAENVAGKDIIKHVVMKLNKKEYCHVRGIIYHDPNAMKHGQYAEPVIKLPLEKKPREFVWMEDGSYYVRGQTPENLWEYETDTSAESEYEPYQSSADDKIVEEDSEDDRLEEEEDYNEWKEKLQPVINHGPKIKKVRRKTINRFENTNDEKQRKKSDGMETTNQIITESHDKNVVNTEKGLPIDETAFNEPYSEKDAEAMRKQRHHRLFPELVSESPQPEESKNTLPKFITELRDITVTDGGSVKLFCIVSSPKPDMKWLKNGEPLEFTKMIKNQTRDSTGIIQLTKVSEADEGVYTAVVKYKDSVIRSQAKVTVIKKPEFSIGRAPIFITGISQHYDFRVDDIILETHIKGDGLIMVQWYLDGIAIENNEKYIQIREPMGVYKLYIHKPQARDNGWYLVKADNDFGSSNRQYYLRFEGKQEKPSYRIFHADPRRKFADDDIKNEPRKHREVVFLEDGTYYVRGQTPERYWEWETDTSAESEFEDYVSEERDSSVEKKVQSIDDGEQSEEVADDTEINVKVASEAQTNDEEIEYVKPMPENEREIKRGQRIKKMRKKRSQLLHLEETLATTKIQSVVKSLSQLEAGDKATESFPPKMRLSQRISSFLFQDRIPDSKQKKKIAEVEFISRLRNQTLLKGKTISLNCCCSENKKLEVIWYKNNQKFEINKRCVSDVHFGFITLEIYRASIEDSGVYECHVTTANGEAKDSCTITVFELPDIQKVEMVPPTFIHPIKETYHSKTNDLYLETRVRGNPIPSLVWVCDGVFILHSTDKYEIFNQHYYELETRITTATLIINNPQLKDSGKYTLIAKNDVQKVEASRQVKIELRSVAHKKKGMYDVIIENETPRVNPKPPTPEPVVLEQENDESLHKEKSGTERVNVAEEIEGEEQESED